MHILKTIHKWLSLIIGLQLVLWLLSGLVFSVLDPEQVKGRHLSRQHIAGTVDGTGKLVDHRDILALYDREGVREEVREITLTTLLNRVVYRVVLADRVDLLDAASGGGIVITAATARAIAERDYAGERAGISSIDQTVAPTLETRRHKGAIWQVAIDDSLNTTLYISAEDGRLLERRNDVWRVFDFFWMLHIMDYQGRQNFNNMLIIGVAFGCLWLVMSGCVLLVGSLRGFNLLRRGSVPVQIHTGAGSRELRLPLGAMFIEGLAGAGIHLPSACGGGGNCGRCQIRMQADAPVSEDDKALISTERLSQGYRLACRQRIERPASLALVDVQNIPVRN